MALPPTCTGASLGLRLMSKKVSVKKTTPEEFERGYLNIITLTKPETHQETTAPEVKGKSLLQVIQEEEVSRLGMKDRTELLSKRNPYRLTAGSIIKVHRVINASDTRPITYLGTVIAIRRRGLGSSITIINKIEGEMIQFNFPVYSPLITRIEVLKRASGKRQKLYKLATTDFCPVISDTASFKDYNHRAAGSKKSAAKSPPSAQKLL